MVQALTASRCVYEAAASITNKAKSVHGTRGMGLESRLRRPQTDDMLPRSSCWSVETDQSTQV